MRKDWNEDREGFDDVVPEDCEYLSMSTEDLSVPCHDGCDEARCDVDCEDRTEGGTGGNGFDGAGKGDVPNMKAEVVETEDDDRVCREDAMDTLRPGCCIEHLVEGRRWRNSWEGRIYVGSPSRAGQGMTASVSGDEGGLALLV